jgi:hypothetical protein
VLNNIGELSCIAVLGVLRFNWEGIKQGHQECLIG